MVWLGSLVLYSSRLILYDDLSVKTLTLVLLCEIATTIGVGLGYGIRRSGERAGWDGLSDHAVDVFDRYIAATAVVAAAAIVPNTIAVFGRYGLGAIVSDVAEVYSDRENGEIGLLGYFSPLIYLSLMLLGVRGRAWGIRRRHLLVIALGLCNAFTFGGRNNVMYAVLFLLVPYVIVGRALGCRSSVGAVRAIVVSFPFVVAFFAINGQRARATVVPEGISLLMQRLVEVEYSTYRTVLYFTEPIAYLNGFLMDPDYRFGSNTFHFIYKQLSKVDASFNVEPSLPFRFVPMPCNVGTYITEVVMDFGGFAPIALGLFGVVLGCSYRRFEERPSNIIAAVVSTVFLVCLYLSFFMWHMRSTNLWVVMLGGIVLGVAMKGPLMVTEYRNVGG
ncbi:O-antigen polymerase [Actinomyces bovis]|nr:O-antigen polymerase [Actinomyces bovis]